MAEDDPEEHKRAPLQEQIDEGTVTSPVRLLKLAGAVASDVGASHLHGKLYAPLRERADSPRLVLTLEIATLEFAAKMWSPRSNVKRCVFTVHSKEITLRIWLRTGSTRFVL